MAIAKWAFFLAAVALVARFFGFTAFAEGLEEVARFLFWPAAPRWPS